MSHLPKVMDAFSRLLTYPDQHTPQTAELLYIVLQSEIDEAAREISRFGTFLEQHEVWQVEESFTSTFDVNPSCALEVGWHLFGEEYARGMFLVRMREELRKYNLPESAELTDHISHVLGVLSAMPDDEAARFSRACVQPAIEKMMQALAKKETPYQHVISALAMVLEQKWGKSDREHQSPLLESQSTEADPLHAFPVANVACVGGGCSGDCNEPEVVSLDFNVPAKGRSIGGQHD